MRMDRDFRHERHEMVTKQIVNKGVSDIAVVSAMRLVPRHLFVPDDRKAMAYSDVTLPLEDGLSIAEPYVVAMALQSAQISSTSKLLEIGLGSGYLATVASRIAKEVYVVAKDERQSEKLEAILSSLHYSNIFIKAGDENLGWLEEAPFHAIIAIGNAKVSEEVIIQLCQAQLHANGKLILLAGEGLFRQLLCLTKKNDGSFDRQLIDLVP